MSKKPTVLMILDGFGLNDKTEGNAVAQAKKPNIDALMKEYPFVKGNASGLAVGLPDGQMGNSEVGHLNMGAGRIVYQELTRITKEINDGEFFSNQALLDGIANVKENNSDLHLYGLLSDGGVHSHITHLYGLLELAKRQGVKNVYVHCFLDGRDTPPASGKEFIEQLEAKMKEIGVGQIGVVSGRYYAMDRDNRWDRVELAYKALTAGEGVKGTDAAAAVQTSYDNDKTDEFVLPTVIEKDGKPVATIQDKDSVVFFNFRPDRAREITRAFCDDEFKGFERAKKLDLTYVCFTDYDETIQNKLVAFHKVQLKNTLSLKKADGVQLYHKLDSHWNNYGAAVAYETVANKLSEVYGDEFKGYTRYSTMPYSVKNNFSGDLQSMLLPGSDRKDEQLEYDVSENFEYTDRCGRSGDNYVK